MKTLLQFVFSAVLLAGALHAESLWLKASPSVMGAYADRRAARAGDILTVIIDESSTMSASQKSKADKTSDINDSVTQWLFSPAVSTLGTKNGETPAVKMAGSNSYEGKGEIANSSSITARAAVMVSDVLPNGNLVIEGARTVAFSKEKQYVVLRGIVRADDVSAANTITSSQIANATVEVISEGEISSAAKKGWLLKLNDLINPF